MFFVKSSHNFKTVFKFNNSVMKRYRIQSYESTIISNLQHYQIPQNYCRRNIHTSYSILAKLYVDRENQYAHSILEKSDNYNLCTNINFNQKSIDDNDCIIDNILGNCLQLENDSNKLYDDFIKLMNYCNRNEICISDEKFDEFIEVFMNNCYKLSDDQLVNSILNLSKLSTSSPYTRNFIELWNSLDDVCNERIEQWSIDKVLLICDCWYIVNLSRVSNFVWSALRKIGRKIRKLSPQQLVHSIFICNLVRKPSIEMFDFEMNFTECIHKLTINEIGVMSMGFFKTQTPIRNPELINEIYKRLIQELDTVEDITLVNILKILRYSSKLQHTDLMYDLLQKLCKQIERLSLLSCLHIALLGIEIQLCEENCIELILKRFNRDIQGSRIKEMERICHVISLFNIKTRNGIENELCKKILNEIKSEQRINEILKYPRSFSSCIYYLILCGYYDNELISTVLDQKFIKHCYGSNLLLGREIFLIDSFTRINLKDENYKGNLLTDKQRKAMGKCLTNYIPDKNSKYKLNVTDRILIEIKDTCQQLLQQNCYFKHILPHFERPDILLCYDKLKQKTIPLNTDKFPDYNGIILYRDVILENEEQQQNIESIAIVVAGWNNFVRDKNRITGLFKLKLKQLEILGHKTIVIPWYSWRELETFKDRLEFIKRKISSFMK